MSVNHFNAPLSIEIKPTLQKYLIISIPHIFALLLLIFIKNLTLLQLLTLACVVLLSFIYSLRLHCFCTLDHSVISIQQDSMNNWLLLFANENEVKLADLIPSSFASNHLIILICKTNNTNYFYSTSSVIITKDSVTEQKFRILKARLNIQRLT